MVTDETKKLIEEAREFTDETAGYAYKSDWDHGQANPLIDRLTDALEAADAEILRQRYVNRRAELQYQELEAERDALRTAIQPVLDAWRIPGIRPDYHEAMKKALRREWFILYHAVDDLSRAIDANGGDHD